MLALASVVVAFIAAPARADMSNSRIGLHVIRLEPEGSDAEDFSEAAWGGNVEAVIVPPGVWDAFAFQVGFEGAELDSKTIHFINRTTGLRTEQQTTQTFLRLFAGGRIGHQGHGTFRPYAGANIALNIFTINTDVVIPNDADPDNEIRQDLDENTETAFGFDVVLGTEFNFSDAWYIDIGGKYIKTFNVPQQLGEEAKKIHPQYIEIYAGAGVTLGFLSRQD
jgi:hypothetical protein